jgi:hypothetical protein
MWVDGILEKGFTPVRPLRKLQDGVRPHPPPYVSSETASMGRFPDFATQSMEDLLNTEGLVTHNVHNAQEFGGGFVGFEEFHGWEGFDINNL